LRQALPQEWRGSGADQILARALVDPDQIFILGANIGLPVGSPPSDQPQNAQWTPDRINIGLRLLAIGANIHPPKRWMMYFCNRQMGLVLLLPTSFKDWRVGGLQKAL
jgi:hypothetical protein